MSEVTSSMVTSPELVLLEMMIENDYNLSEADKATRDNAREAQLEAMKEELDAISDQADAIRMGAFVEGSLQAAGGSMAIDGAASGDNALVKEGELYRGLAQPAGAFLGDAAQTDAEHDAKAAAQEQEQASWVADDAEEHRQKVELHAETMLKQVQSVLDTQHQTTVAVIANI